jgi:hypothetical protein
MSEKWAELSVAMDVWKSANLEVGEGRTVRLLSARCGGDERGASGDAVDGRSAGGRRGRNGDEADVGSGRPVGATRGVSRDPSYGGDMHCV